MTLFSLCLQNILQFAFLLSVNQTFLFLFFFFITDWFSLCCPEKLKVTLMTSCSIRRLHGSLIMYTGIFCFVIILSRIFKKFYMIPVVFMEERLFSLKSSAGNIGTNSSFKYKLHILVALQSRQ